jgi:uncharacterized protein YuzE
MKLSYFPDTDSLYIDLTDAPSTESREVSEGVVLDYDAGGNLVGIDINHASRKIDLRTVTLSRLPPLMPADTETRPSNSFHGFEPFAGGSARVTNEDIDRIRDGMDD